MGFLIHGIFNTWFSSILSSFPYCKTVFLRPSNTVKLYVSFPPLPPPPTTPDPHPPAVLSNAKNPSQKSAKFWSVNRLFIDPGVHISLAL